MVFIKKNLWLILFVLITLIAVAYTEWGKESIQPDVLSKTNYPETQKEFPDRDGDGLKDWEEILRKTNPNDPDTDKDGILDGQEMKESDTPDSLSLKKESFGNWPVPIPEKNIADTDEKQGTIGRNTTDVDMKANPKKYGNALGEIIREYAEYIAEGPELFKEIIETPALTTWERLRALGSAYESLSGLIVATEGPPPYAPLGKNLSNTYSSLGENIKQLVAEGRKGNISGTSWIKYNEAVVLVGEGLFALAREFKDNSITFSPLEAGSIFSY